MVSSSPSATPARAAPSATRLAFAGFEVDTRAGTLTCGGRPVALRRQTWQLLCVLLVNAGRLCTADELRAELWPHAVVGADSLVQCVVELRRALGDRGHRLLRTVPRRGYRLDAVVVGADTVVSDPGTVVVPAPGPLVPTAEGAEEAPRLLPLWSALAVVETSFDVAAARTGFEHAVGSAEARAEALAGIAMTHVVDLLHRWSPHAAWSRMLAREAAEEAVALAPSSARARHARAHVALLEGRHVEALLGFQATLRRAPTMARAMIRIGLVEMELGQPARTEAHVRRALAVGGADPVVQAQACFVAGMAAFHLGQDAAAEAWMEAALRARPSSAFAHQWLAALRALAGDADRAARHLAAFEHYVPGHSIASLCDTERSRVEAFVVPRQRFYQGLARAGLSA